MLGVLKNSIGKRAEVDMTNVGIAKNRVGESFEVFVKGNDEYLGITDKQFDIFNAIEEMYEIVDWDFTQENNKTSMLRIRFDMKNELEGLILLLAEKLEEFNEIDEEWHRKLNEIKKIQKQIEMSVDKDGEIEVC